MANHDENADTIVFGLHAVQALMTHHPERIHTLFINHERHDEKIRRLIHVAQQTQLPLQLLSKTAFDAYAERYQAHASQGVIALCKTTMPADNITTIEELFAQLNDQKPLLLILDGVQDPHNLGACLRSANAAGAQAVIIPKDRAAPLNATVRKVASGAAEITPVITVTNLARTLQWLKDQGVWLYGMADEAKMPLYQADFTYPSAFILGAEGEGLRRLTREYCDELLAIPMAGSVSSLNVSVAAGVCLFEAVRQRKVKNPA